MRGHVAAVARQDLQGDFALQVDVLRLVDDTHPALAEQLDDTVGAELFGQLFHHGRCCGATKPDRGNTPLELLVGGFPAIHRHAADTPKPADHRVVAIVQLEQGVFAPLTLLQMSGNPLQRVLVELAETEGRQFGRIRTSRPAVVTLTVSVHPITPGSRPAPALSGRYARHSALGVTQWPRQTPLATAAGFVT